MKKEFIKRYGWTLLGIVAGMVGGYLYWRYVGCTTGTCPITSSPVNSTIWGAAMGGLLLYNFEKNPEEWKYEGDKPAIVDFYADWCGPCKMVAPILDELAKEYDGQIVIYKVDTEKEQELAGAFGIRSIPSILFIPMEGKPEMAQGAMPKASFKKAIDEFLLKK